MCLCQENDGPKDGSADRLDKKLMDGSFNCFSDEIDNLIFECASVGTRDGNCNIIEFLGEESIDG